MLQGDLVSEERLVFRRLWKAKAPSGLLALAWRVLIGKVQTKIDLARRNALPVNTSLSCGLCAVEEESCKHLFFTCGVSWKVWMEICFWLGVHTAFSCEAESHFFLHENLISCKMKDGKIMNLIWIAVVNSIWQTRNGSVFNGVGVEVVRIVELVKYKVWLWLRTHDRNFISSFYEWENNPKECIAMLH
ncbi:uncharacterized protein LOC130719485 [Lotus japonicus]|uniref:uncharacterized protein LOC130719485 n=1 Tax=Lotus japonicus TaxID=34305 RepID=UPI0025905382|nr:uncharacterized protein LOC130719485 [Lotus japonicus]